MKAIIVVFIFLFTLNPCGKQATASSFINLPEKEDSLLLHKIYDQLKGQSHLPIGELLAKIGKTFLGTPYVANTLENGRDEKLVINLRELDCTTFAENCLAITRCIKSGNTNPQSFASELENIRYRNGMCNDYSSRLHYFSDWIFDNEQKGFIVQPEELSFFPFETNVNFMSEHPNSYMVLKENPELLTIIAKQENQISRRKLSFLPKSKIKENEFLLKEGDIIGLATSIKGLDIAHVGILVKENDGRIHLMHASSSEMEVVISEKTLDVFLQQKKSYTGILIARPIY